MKKTGISLIALVITVIVLVVLTAAVILNGINTPKNTRLAVFYNNISTVQEAVTLKMMNNLSKYSTDETKNLKVYKWSGVIQGFLPGEEQPDFANSVVKINDAISLLQISDDISKSVSISIDEIRKYFVDENGVVYYYNDGQGFLAEDGTRYYNRTDTATVIATQYYNVTINAITNGTVTADKTSNIAEGENVTLTITPENDYVLDTLTVDGVEVSASVVENGYAFAMPAHDVTITATFGPALYTFSVDPNITNGTVVPNKTVNITENEVVAVTITPDEGYRLKSFTISGEDFTSSVSGGVLQIYMPNVDLVATAVFEEVVGTPLSSETIPIGTVINLDQALGGTVNNWIVVGKTTTSTILTSEQPVGSLYLYGRAGYNSGISSINNTAINTVGTISIAGASVRAANGSDFSSYLTGRSTGMTYWLASTWNMYYLQMCKNGSLYNQVMHMTSGSISIDNGGGQYPVRPILTIPNTTIVTQQDGVWKY